MNIPELTKWLNDTYPDRNWDQQCQRLVWNTVQHLTGVPESDMVTYPTATAARLASRIVSTDASKAPVGAVHYWLRPDEGHVGVSLGGERVLMTGTPGALGRDGETLGRGYGITTVSSYGRAKGNPYLGWSYRNGENPQIVPPEKHQEVATILEETMANPIVNVKPDTVWIGRNDGTFEQLDGSAVKAMNTRGIISHVFLGAIDGKKDTIPSVSKYDFEVVKTVWAQMCKGAK